MAATEKSGVYIDPAEFASLQRFYRAAPREARNMLRRLLRAKGREWRDQVRRERLSGPTGPGRLGRTSGRKYLKLRGGGTRRHVRESWIEKVKVGTRGPDALGGYMVLKSPRKYGAHHILRFQEAGTEHIRGKGMIEAATPGIEQDAMRTIIPAVESAVVKEFNKK